MTDSKLIVFDTDGVIFRSQLLLQLSRHSGKLTYFRALFLCFMFNINCLTLLQLLEKVYGRLKGIKEEEFWQVYYKMDLVRNAEETVRSIRNKGHHVTLISSGVPDFIMKHLAKSLHANHGFGIETKMDNGMFTGKIGGPLSSHDGKTKVIEQILNENTITWNNVIVVGDDRNNLDIMALAKASIGFNSNYSVRKKAKYLADGNDLKKVLDYIEIEDSPTFVELSSGLQREFTYSWKQEYRRKGVHFCAASFPFFATINFSLTINLLLIMSMFYVLSEWLRLNGVAFPAFNLTTRLCIRTSEKRHFAVAPLALSLGIILSLLIFPALIACVVILIVAFSDSIATLIGRFYGKHTIPYNKRKSLEGSFAFLVSAFIICYFLNVPLKVALLASFVSCIIESLPLKYDNITIPLGTGVFLVLIT